MKNYIGEEKKEEKTIYKIRLKEAEKQLYKYLKEKKDLERI